MIYKNRKNRVFIVAALAVLCASFLASPVMATSSVAAGEDIEDKILLNTLRHCYKDVDSENKAFMNKDISLGYVSGSDVVAYENAESVFPTEPKNNFYYITSDKHPATNNAYCKDIISKYYGARVPSIIYSGDPDSGRRVRSGSTDVEVVTFLKGLGYEESVNESKALCVKILYGVGGWNDYQQYFDDWSKLSTLSYICWENNEVFSNGDGIAYGAQIFPVQLSPEITKDRITTDNATGTKHEIFIPIESLDFEDNAYYPRLILEYHDTKKAGDYGQVTFADDKAAFNAYECIRKDDYHTFCGHSTTNFLFFEEIVPISKLGEIEGFSPVYSFNIKNGWREAVDYFMDLYTPEYKPNTIMIQFYRQQIYELYMHYLIDYYSIIVDETNCGGSYDGNSVYTERGWCPIFTYTSPMHAEEKVAIFDENYEVLSRLIGRDELVGELYNIVSQSEHINGVGVNSDGTLKNPLQYLVARGKVFETDDPCYNSAGSQSWLLCPIMEGLGNSLSNLYNSTIKGYMRVDSFLLTPASGKDQGSGTYQAWRIFTDMGNVILVIFFLVVIFSQLTGVGIDNYGIKKALPKIIIAAILINASFLISQVVADLSNIIGNAIEEMLSGIGDQIAQNAGLPEAAAAMAGGGRFEFILKAVMLTAGALAIGNFVYTGISKSWISAITSLIIPLLFVLLIALVAVLFFYIMLGIRKASIVILVAASPIALACYMLPNAKRLVFDRWFKIFRVMIVAYPICGLLVGGSGLASAIMMNSGMTKNFLFYAINMLLMVVPFFFIPTLIKGSISAMGSLAQKAQGAIRSRGKKAGSRADTAYKNSANYKRREAFAQKEMNRSRASIDLRMAGAKQKANSKLKGSKFGLFSAIGARNQRAIDAQVAAAREALVQEDKKNRSIELHKMEGWEDSARNANTLAVQKEALDYANLGKADYAESKAYLQVQASNNEYGKIARFGDLDVRGRPTDKAQKARTALQHKMFLDRDSEEHMDRVYSTEMARTAGVDANTIKALQKMQENSAAALIAGRMQVQVGVDVNGNVQLETVVSGRLNRLDANGNVVPVESRGAGDMSKALYDILSRIDDQNLSDQARLELRANADVLQDEMMRTDDGRVAIQDVYEKLRTENGGIPVQSSIRNVAADFMNSYGAKVKGYNRAFHGMMVDIAVQGNPVSTDENKYGAKGVEKIQTGNIARYDASYLEGVVKQMKRINNLKQLWIASGKDPRFKPDDKQLDQLKQFLELRRRYQNDSRSKNSEITRILVDDTADIKDDPTGNFGP